MSFPQLIQAVKNLLCVMRVGIIQLHSGNNKERNVRKAYDCVDRAARHGAEFILLPEIFPYRGRMTRRKLIEDVAEDIPGPSILPLLEIARRYKIFLLAGSIFEKVPGHNKAFNTAVFINNRGVIEGLYRKRHLFEADIGGRVICEAKNFLPGQALFVARVKDIKIGVSICYDLRFPEIYQAYRRAGCHVLAVPSSFTRRTGQAHWEALARARAIENLCYVLGPNQVGRDEQGLLAHGHSLIVSPWGEVMARGSGHREEILYADIQLADVKAARKKLPGLFKGR